MVKIRNLLGGIILLLVSMVATASLETVTAPAIAIPIILLLGIMFGAGVMFLIEGILDVLGETLK